MLIRFEDEDKSEEFYLNQHDQPYNLIDDTICHLAFVSSIEFGETEVSFFQGLSDFNHKNVLHNTQNLLI